jgi:uncharacterized damage-inducible protein DinB
MQRQVRGRLLQMLDVLLESWDRQCQTLDNLFELATEDLKDQRPSEDGMPIFEQFAHIHNTRRAWLSQFSPKHLEGYGRSYVQAGADEWKPVQDLAQLRELLKQSAKAVRDATREAIEAGVTERGGYDHPVFFLQHMLWHEGYHFGLIMLALRLAGTEPSEEWEEEKVWGLWRVEE